MSKKIKVLSLVAIVLVTVLGLSMIALLQPKANTDASQDPTFSTGSDIVVPDVLLDQAPNVSFTVFANGMDADRVAELVVVRGTDGEVAVDVEEIGNGYFGITPVSAYVAGGAYTIELSSGLRFSKTGYEGKSSIDFIIEKEEVNDIAFADGVIVLEAGTFTKKSSETIAVANLGDIAVGSIIVIPVGEAQEAYKVTAIANDGGSATLGVVDAELNEVVDNIDVNRKVDMSEGTITFNEDSLVEQLQFGALADALQKAGIGVPRISIPIKEYNKEEGKAKIAIELRLDDIGGISETLPGGNISLVITILNDIKISPTVNYTTAPFTFNLSADMDIKTTTTFSINTGYSASGRDNAAEVVKALDEIFRSEDEIAESPLSESALKIFKWSYPIGPLLISYDLDLFFNIGFAGALDVACVNESGYTLGAYYLKDNANDEKKNFKVIADQKYFTKPELTEASMFGKLTAQAGVSNSLSLEIFQIAKVGLVIDFGAFIRVYGVIDVNVSDISQTNGGYFIESGLFYDINIKAGLNILFININESFNLAYGEIPFGDPLGSKYMNSTVALEQGDKITVSGNLLILPEFIITYYDITMFGQEAAKMTRVADVSELVFVIPDGANYSVSEDGILTVNSDAAASFEEELIVRLKDDEQIYTTVTISKFNNTPYAVEPLQTYDKSVAQKTATYEIELIDSSFSKLEGNNITSSDYYFNNNVITISYDYLVKLPNGRYTFTVKTFTNQFEIYVDIIGKVSLFTVGSGTQKDPYLLYTADQFIEMSEKAGKENGYQSVHFKLKDDISFNGEVFNPISQFKGTLEGDGHIIKDFVINTVVTDQNAAGFIGINHGTINNVRFGGTVTINGVKAPRVGVIAGVNTAYATISNCVVDGNVSATYKTNASRHSDFNVGGIVGMNLGSVLNNTVAGTVYVKSYGSSVSSTVYAANVVGYNTGVVSSNTVSNTLTNDTVGWHSSITNGVSNNR